MKTKNLYYAAMVRRTSSIKLTILLFFLAIASWPRLLLEVFIRKSFGERYFSLSTAIIITFVLGVVPYAYDFSHGYYGRLGLLDLFSHHIFWYGYLAAFLYFSYTRQKEVDREPGVFDFAKYSLYNGDIHDLFWNIDLPGITTTRRLVSTCYEPGFFFIVGVVLTTVGSDLGPLLIVTSICYSLSYVGAYYVGDQFIMDKIDEMICSEELADTFISGKQPENARGFEFIPKMPKDVNFRKQFIKHFYEEEDVADDVI